jgi:glucokinase
MAVGVDIGGTSAKLGLVDERGRVLARDTFPTGRGSRRAETLRLLAARVRELAARAPRGAKVVGVGVGAPGPIDVERGLVYFFPNLPGWKNTPLRALLERRLRLPVALDNDANAMALGEAYFGAGRGVRNVVALTLGTGIGGGIVLDGRLFHGPHFSAAEMGHIPISESGPRCGCGSRGCVETYVGNGYFSAETRRRLEVGERSVLARWIAEGEELTPRLVARAARAGDRLARRRWEETAGHLATALAGLLNVLNPERVVIGGGVAQSGALLFRPLAKALKRKAFLIAVRSVKVVSARLGTDAGLVGAAALAFALHEGKKDRVLRSR